MSSNKKQLKIDYCIIGGGIAGTTAAETIRALDKKGSILIISGEPYTLYSRVMLSKAHYILQESPEDRAILRTVAQYKEQSIEFYSGIKVDSISTSKKQLSLNSGETVLYKKLLITTGGRAIVPSYLEKSFDNAHALQNIDHARKIIRSLEGVKKVVVIGGGFISFEMASIYAKAGKEVVVCLRGDRFWRKALHCDASKIIEDALEREGVVIKKKVEVDSVVGENTIKEVVLSSGEKLPCDLVVYGIGTNYYQKWLEGSDIKQEKGIIINAYLQTNITDVWAAGDCAEYPETITKEVSMPGNWANAQMQGKYVGGAMVKKEKEPFSYISSYTSAGSGLILSFIGDTRRGVYDKTILRGGREIYPKFSELFIKNNTLIGAILINRGNEIIPLREIITKKVPIEKIIKELQKTTTDLKTLI